VPAPAPAPAPFALGISSVIAADLPVPARLRVTIPAGVGPGVALFALESLTGGIALPTDWSAFVDVPAGTPSFLKAGRDGRQPHHGPLIVGLGDGSRPVVVQLRFALFSRQASNPRSLRWFRLRADVHSRGTVLRALSPPFVSASKAGATLAQLTAPPPPPPPATIVNSPEVKLRQREALKRQLVASLAEAQLRSALRASQSALALAAHAARAAEAQKQAPRAGLPGGGSLPPMRLRGEQSAALSARYQGALIALEHHLRRHQVAQLQVRVEREQQVHARLSATLTASAAVAAKSCAPKQKASSTSASVHAAHVSARALLAAQLRREEAMDARRGACFVFR
jgi:hypothetical protein